MDDLQQKRLSNAELRALFDRLFPHGFAGPDVLSEIAPEGWERSPVLACFHPSIERVFEERLLMHRNLEGLRRIGRRRDGDMSHGSSPELTLEGVQKELLDDLHAAEGDGRRLDPSLSGTSNRGAHVGG